MIPYGRQTISERDIEAVVDVLRSDYLTQGPAVPKFERSVAQRCNVPHAVAVSNATSALHIACIALGLKPGDVLWTSPNTFVASANCARYCGATVDFVDIDPVSYNMSIELLEEKLRCAAKAGTLPKIVVPVHFAGQPCDMEPIAKLASEYGFAVIEDASHAIGATYRDSIIGDCTYSDITVFSFHPVKIITCGEGGVATCKSSELASKMELLRSHGITRKQGELSHAGEGSWYYEQQMLGFNYRMTDLQAALGDSQLARLEEFIAVRTAIARRYDDLLAPLPVRLPSQSSVGRSSLHLYPVRLPSEPGQRTRRRVFDAMRASDVGVNVHYIPVHLQPYYRNLGFKAGDFPNAEDYYSEVISLPIYPGLTVGQQDVVVSSLERSLLS